MAMRIPRSVKLVEVGPRDGLQNEKALLEVDQKLEFIHRLEAAGARRMETVSFVNPKRVPQMAGAEEISAALARFDASGGLFISLLSDPTYGGPTASFAMLGGLDVLFLDALRYKPHPTHSTVERSSRTADRLGPQRTYFTHICHDLGHERAESMLPPHIRLAYDGLEIQVAGMQ